MWIGKAGWGLIVDDWQEMSEGVSKRMSWQKYAEFPRVRFKDPSRGTGQIKLDAIRDRVFAKQYSSKVG